MTLEPWRSARDRERAERNGAMKKETGLGTGLVGLRIVASAIETL
jgi:hypothetical protein